MSAPYHNLLYKCDAALVAYLVSVGAGTVDDVFPAKRSLGRALPSTVCHSESGVEDVAYTGRYSVTASVNVRCPMPVDVGDTSAEAVEYSNDRVAATFDALKMSTGQEGRTLANLITAAATAAGVEDFTALNVIDRGIEQGPDQDAWVDTIRLEILCCPSTIENT